MSEKFYKFIYFEDPTSSNDEDYFCVQITKGIHVGSIIRFSNLDFKNNEISYTVKTDNRLNEEGVLELSKQVISDILATMAQEDAKP